MRTPLIRDCDSITSFGRRRTVVDVDLDELDEYVREVDAYAPAADPARVTTIAELDPELPRGSSHFEWSN